MRSDLLSACRKHEDVRIAELSNAAAYLESIEARQHQVENDQVWRERPRAFHGGRPIRRDHNVKALVLEVSLDQVDEIGLVIDDQHFGHARTTCMMAEQRPSGAPFVPATTHPTWEGVDNQRESDL
jgi:hypothetical protein